MNFLFLDTVGYESALRLSGHHYARLLVKRRHRVLSLSSPVTPFHALRRTPEIARRFANHRRGFVAAPGAVHHYVPFSLLPVRKLYPFDQPWMLELAARTWMGDVLKRLRLMAFKPDVISLQNMMLWPLAKQFPEAVLHYRMEDLLSGFADMPKSMIEAERKVLESADIISLTSPQFERVLSESQRKKAIIAPNAVEADRFAKPMPRPEAYASITKPIAVYIGALRAWFDWDLLRSVALALPDVLFLIISPDPLRADLGQLPNVTHHPGVPYEELPAYYQHAAVSIIPFVDSPLVAPVNPMKMYECLAAGTPVVCSRWAQLEEMKAPVALARNADEFVDAIHRGIATPRPVDYSGFVSAHSWEKNLDELLTRIETVRIGISGSSVP